MSGLSFPKKARLLRAEEFDAVFQKGRREATPCMQVLARLSENPEAEASSRLGLVVSRKVGNAVQRNKIKRRLREIFRKNRLSLDHLEFVIVARPKISKARFSLVESDFNVCTRRLYRQLLGHH